MVVLWVLIFSLCEGSNEDGAGRGVGPESGHTPSLSVSYQWSSSLMFSLFPSTPYPPHHGMSYEVRSKSAATVPVHSAGASNTFH